MPRPPLRRELFPLSCGTSTVVEADVELPEASTQVTVMV